MRRMNDIRRDARQRAEGKKIDRAFRAQYGLTVKQEREVMDLLRYGASRTTAEAVAYVKDNAAREASIRRGAASVRRWAARRAQGE